MSRLFRFLRVIGLAECFSYAFLLWACVCMWLAWLPYFITKMQNYFENNHSRYDTHFRFIHNVLGGRVCSRDKYVCGHMFVYSFVCTSLSSTFYVYLQCRTSCQHSTCSANSYANAHTQRHKNAIKHRFKWLNIIYLLLLVLLWLFQVEYLRNEFDDISVILYNFHKRVLLNKINHHFSWWPL